MSFEMPKPVAYANGAYGGHFTYKTVNPALVLPMGITFFTAQECRWAYVNGLTDAVALCDEYSRANAESDVAVEMLTHLAAAISRLEAAL